MHTNLCQVSITVLLTCLGVGVYCMWWASCGCLLYKTRYGYFVSNEDIRSVLQAQVPQNTYIAVYQHLKLVGRCLLYMWPLLTQHPWDQPWGSEHECNQFSGVARAIVIILTMHNQAGEYYTYTLVINDFSGVTGYSRYIDRGIGVEDSKLFCWFAPSMTCMGKGWLHSHCYMRISDSTVMMSI